MTQDVRYSLRSLRNAPAFTAIALAVLAIGIGANTAMFGIVDAILLRPLPWPGSERLYMVREMIRKITPDPIPVSAPDTVDFARLNSTFENTGAFFRSTYEMSGRSTPRRVDGTRIAPSVFTMLEARPLLGRTITAADDRERAHVLLLSYGTWQSDFGGDRGVLGATVRLDRVPYTVIGVMPREFDFPVRGTARAPGSALWIPLALSDNELAGRGDNFNFEVIAKLKPGVPAGRMKQDLAQTFSKIEALYPKGISDFHLEAVAVPLRQEIAGNVSAMLYILLAAVGTVLLISCANVANLLLSRAVGRQRELAIRGALGASRRRLVRQLLTESVLLAVAGGALGAGLAWWATEAFARFAAGLLPLASAIRLDERVLLFALAISMAAGLIVGTYPAFAASRTTPIQDLKDGGKGSTASRGRAWARGALVIVEVALTVVLLIGSGLLIRSFEAVRGTDPGIRAEHAVEFGVALPETQYRGVAEIKSFDERLLAAMNSLPGVRSVAVANDLPLEDVSWMRVFAVEGRRDFGAKPPLCAHTVAMGGYPEALGLRLLAGRWFGSHDTPESPGVVVINQTLAQRWFGTTNATGKRIKWGMPSNSSPWIEIIGVVSDVKEKTLDKPALPHTYESILQLPAETAPLLRQAYVIARVDGAPGVIAQDMRRALAGLDASLPMSQFRTMDEVIASSLGSRRLSTSLLSGFGLIALILAALGIYGVVSYSVSQRTQEIGIRMALGATAREVIARILLQGAGLAAVGLAAGLGSALFLQRIMSSMLYGVSGLDPLTFAAAPAFLLLVCAAAVLIPALRAVRVDPMTALRSE